LDLIRVSRPKQNKTVRIIKNISCLVFPLALIVGGFSNSVAAGIYCSAFAGIILFFLWITLRIEAKKQKDKSN
jgi:hypothetical protein